MTETARVRLPDPETLRRRWRGSLIIFFLFMLLHQTDLYLIGPLTTPIMEAFHINEAQMGAVQTGAIVVGAVFFPLWGYLYDRYARPRILATASLIWGATTWLAAIVPSFPQFVATRASTGIDDASYPGIYSMVSDLFGPERRGRAIATLQLAAPLSFIIATGLAYSLRGAVGWRGVFAVTGTLGVIMVAVIYFKLRDVPRGASPRHYPPAPRCLWRALPGQHPRCCALPFEQSAFGVYEKFRPQIPKGTQGWGAKGELDIGKIRRLAK